MIFTKTELRDLGFIPQTKYELGKKFPDGFELPQSVKNEDFKNLPLYIQVRYEYSSNGQVHLRK